MDGQQPSVPPPGNLGAASTHAEVVTPSQPKTYSKVNSGGYSHVIRRAVGLTGQMMSGSVCQSNSGSHQPAILSGKGPTIRKSGSNIHWSDVEIERAYHKVGYRSLLPSGGGGSQVRSLNEGRWRRNGQRQH